MYEREDLLENAGAAVCLAVCLAIVLIVFALLKACPLPPPPIPHETIHRADPRNSPDYKPPCLGDSPWHDSDNDDDDDGTFNPPDPTNKYNPLSPFKGLW